MMNNDAVKRIDARIKSAKQIILLTHANADGDALGTSLALLSVLCRVYKKHATLVLQEAVPQKYRFLHGWENACVWPDGKDADYDLVLCADTGDTALLNDRAAFLKNRYVISIDHHLQRRPFADDELYKPEYSSAGEVTFELFEALKIVPDDNESASLYTAIVSDTGGFQHDNTGANTHRVVQKLMEHSKIDTSGIANKLFNSSTRERNRLVAAVLGSLHYVGERKNICIGSITREMLNRTLTGDEDTEGIINCLLNTQGVDVAVLIKERQENTCKVSFRSRNADVSAIAAEFGGGGHVKAAGCTIEVSPDKAELMLTERFLKADL